MFQFRNVPNALQALAPLHSKSIIRKFFYILLQAANFKQKHFRVFNSLSTPSKLVDTDTEVHSGLTLPDRGGREPEDTQQQHDHGSRGAERQPRTPPSRPILRPPALTAVRRPRTHTPLPCPAPRSRRSPRGPTAPRSEAQTEPAPRAAGTHPPCPSPPRTANQPARPHGGNERARTSASASARRNPVGSQWLSRAARAARAHAQLCLKPRARSRGRLRPAPPGTRAGWRSCAVVLPRGAAPG